MQYNEHSCNSSSSESANPVSDGSDDQNLDPNVVSVPSQIFLEVFVSEPVAHGLSMRSSRPVS